MGSRDLDPAEAPTALLGSDGAGTSDRGAAPTVCPGRLAARRRAGRTQGNLVSPSTVERLVTPADRAALLADLEAYSPPNLTGAQAILDDVELGSRVAETFAATSST